MTSVFLGENWLVKRPWATYNLGNELSALMVKETFVYDCSSVGQGFSVLILGSVPHTCITMLGGLVKFGLSYKEKKWRQFEQKDYSLRLT